MNVTGDKISKAELLEHLKGLLEDAERDSDSALSDTMKCYYNGHIAVLRELIDDLEYY